jgi:outer membrane receptor protein involved in Fe transport
LGARASWTPKGTQLTLSAYGNNLTNRKVFIAAFPSAAADGVSYDAPRSYGVAASLKF